MAPPRILIVEDEMLLAKDLAKRLTGSGFEVVARVTSGEEAVRKAKETRPDLVLMDIKLEGKMDGIEAASQIRSLRDVAVIYLTAHQERDVLDRAKLTEPHAYLTKPVSPRELERTVEMALYKHRTEKKIKESEHELKLTLGATTDGIWKWNFKTNELFFSDRYYTMLGYEPGEFPASYESWNSLIHPDDRDSCFAVAEKYLESKPDLYDNEFRLRTKDGRYRWIHTRARVVEWDDAGEAVRMIGNHEDITDRKMAEEALLESQRRYSLATNAGKTGVWDWDLNTNEVYLDTVLKGFLGYRDDEITNDIEEWGKHVHSADREQVFAEVERCLSGDEQDYEVEHRMIHKDGSVRWILARGLPIRDDRGKPIRFLGTDTDITDRKKAEEALKESEANYRFLAENMHDIVWTVDLDMKTTYVSPSIEKVLGFTPEERLDQTVSQQLTPESLELAKRSLLGELERESENDARDSSITLELDYFRKDGSIACLESVLVFIRDENSNPIGIYGLSRDITDRKNAEEAQRESQAKYQSIVDSFEGLLYIISSDYEIQFMNERLMKRTGRNALGEKCYQVLHDQDDICSWCLAEAAWRGDTVQWEVLSPKDNRWYSAINSPVGRADGTASMMGMLQDMTDRKTAEEDRSRLATISEQAGESIVVTDRDGAIQYVNPAFEKVTGYAAREAIGQNPRFLNSGEHDEEFYKEMWATLIRGDTWRGHLVNKNKEGKLFEEDATISPVEDEFGNIVSYVAVKRDVTAQVLLEKQLYQAQKMESIGTLAGGIAHDFNNLLQIVLGYADMIMMDKGEQSQDRRNLDIIRQAATDGRDLVKGLLTFSRQVESELRPVNLNQQLKRVQRILRRMVPRMIEIRLSLGDDLNAVNADSVQVEQVLLNLAVNAQHAMPKGGKLTIETRNVTLDEDYCRTQVEAEPGEHVLLKISDTGHGMEKETVARIFEPFYTTKEAGVGTGLGLSIVYGIVRNHGGHVTCSSEPGQGTTFTIYLPAFSEAAKFDPPMTAGHMPAFGTETILLVDDEDLIRDMIERTLRRSGYKVFTAENGDKALEIYREKMEEIDLIVLDLIMPEMGGEECLDEILKINPAARVLIASGFLAKKSRKAVLERGALGLIGKPCDAGDLLRAARKVLEETGVPAGRTGGKSAASVPSADEGESISTVTPSLDEASAPQETPDVDDLPGRLSILVIDDRERFLAACKVGLAQFGHTPLTAVSGIEGLQLFQESPVDLVICDLEMPELSGWDVGKRIQEICRKNAIPKTPFVLLTGQMDTEDMRQEDREKMADCGVDAIVGKPIDIPDLLKVAEPFLKTRQRDPE